MVCGTLRLARFNVSGKKDGFEGIPITAGGFIVALFLLVKDIVPYFEYTFVALLVILSLLMVSTISYPKIKNPLTLAPMVIILMFNIFAFYLGLTDLAKKGSLLMFILIMVYVLSPIGMKLYDRNK
jgi:CDP-diacylglycerol--serine O-phosphatidyltransferase